MQRMATTGLACLHSIDDRSFSVAERRYRGKADIKKVSPKTLISSMCPSSFLFRCTI